MNPNKKYTQKEAVALSYNVHFDDSPQVIAKGKGKIAERIIEEAAENKVPIYEDPSLSGLLSELNLNQNIPTELFQAVAEVFAFIYKAEKMVAEKEDR